MESLLTSHLWLKPSKSGFSGYSPKLYIEPQINWIWKMISLMDMLDMAISLGFMQKSRAVVPHVWYLSHAVPHNVPSYWWCIYIYCICNSCSGYWKPRKSHKVCMGDCSPHGTPHTNRWKKSHQQFPLLECRQFFDKSVTWEILKMVQPHENASCTIVKNMCFGIRLTSFDCANPIVNAAFMGVVKIYAMEYRWLHFKGTPWLYISFWWFALVHPPWGCIPLSGLQVITHWPGVYFPRPLNWDAHRFYNPRKTSFRPLRSHWETQKFANPTFANVFFPFKLPFFGASIVMGGPQASIGWFLFHGKSQSKMDDSGVPSF